MILLDYSVLPDIEKPLTLRDVETKLSAPVLFRYVYIPYVLCGIMFDYMDTLRDQSACLRIEELKKPSRELLRLRQEFVYRQSRFMSRQSLDREDGHAVWLQEVEADLFSDMWRDMSEAVGKAAGDRDDDTRYLVSTAMCALAVHRSVMKFGAISDAVIERELVHVGSTILPPEALEAGGIIRRYTLGVPVDGVQVLIDMYADRIVDVGERVRMRGNFC